MDIIIQVIKKSIYLLCISEHFEEIFKETTNKYFPIRRINIGLNNLQDDSFTTITFFTDIEAEEKERKLQETIVGLRNKYGNKRKYQFKR